MQSACVPADITHNNESVNSVIITYSSYYFFLSVVQVPLHFHSVTFSRYLHTVSCMSITGQHCPSQDTLSITGHTVHHRTHCPSQDNTVHHRTTLSITGHTVHHRTHCPSQDTLSITGHTVHQRTHCPSQDTPSITGHTVHHKTTLSHYSILHTLFHHFPWFIMI